MGCAMSISSHLLAPLVHCNLAPIPVISGLFLHTSHLLLTNWVDAMPYLRYSMFDATGPFPHAEAAPFFGFPDTTHLFSLLPPGYLCDFLGYCFSSAHSRVSVLWGFDPRIWSLLALCGVLGMFHLSVWHLYGDGYLTSIIFPNFQNHAFNNLLQTQHDQPL